MAKKKMPPEILELFKKKAGKNSPKNDNEKRKEAVSKARRRLEEKSKSKDK